MTTNNDNANELPEDPVLYFGKNAIIAPLIIGGALVAGALMMWQTHNRKVQAVEMTLIEEKARVELRKAYTEMRALKPVDALERADNVERLIKSLNAKLAPDYAPLKIAMLLVQGESLFMKDCAANSEAAEAKFAEALNLMQFASGGMWQFGMLGRARARFESGKYREALQDLDSVMDRNPSYGSAYYWRSLTREKLGDHVGAKQDENKAKALDSWPPLRDFMQASCVWTRDIINKPNPSEMDDAACAVDGAGDPLKNHSIAPFFVPGNDESKDNEQDGGVE